MEKSGKLDADNKYKKIISLKQADIMIEEYLHNKEFEKDIRSIVSSQKQYSKKAETIFQPRKLEGPSPVRALIRGQNPGLYYK